MVKISSILQIITYLVVVISYAAVFQYVELYYSLSFGFLFALSVYLNFNRFIKISRWVLNSISIVVLIVSVLTVTTDYLVEPVLGALVVLIAIKLLDEKAFRDYAQIFAMCIFLLIGSSLLSLGIAFLGYFSLTAVLIHNRIDSPGLFCSRSRNYHPQKRSQQSFAAISSHLRHRPTRIVDLLRHFASHQLSDLKLSQQGWLCQSRLHGQHQPWGNI